MGRALSVLREPFIVIGAIVILQFVVYSDYFSGAVIPQFDFLSAYNFEAFAWWNDGGFFDPPQWMPYIWGGYPSVSNFQNGSFYLPIGIASAFGPYTLHSAAVVSALHTGFGALGAYAFARRWGVSTLPALGALTGWFFAPGFFANASHLDIARGYAWVPWVLLVLSIRWPWWQWWGMPVAVLLLWQAILGVYPGVLIAIGYTGIAWVVAQQILFRHPLPRYLLPLMTASILAGLMTALRFLPALAERGDRPFENEDLSTFSFANLGAFLYPYDNPQFGSFAIFQSYFIPASLLAALAFVLAAKSERLTVALLAPAGVGILMGLPNFPWSDVLTNLPGMDLSRFRTSDFKVIVIFAMVMVAVSSLQTLAEYRSERNAVGSDVPRSRWRIVFSVSLLAALVAGAALVAVRYGFTGSIAVAQWLLLVVSATLLTWLLFARRARAAIVASIVLLVGVSGVVNVFAVPGFWRSDRVLTESQYLGSSVEQLLSERRPLGIQREARVAPPPAGFPQDNLSSRYSAAFYTGRPSLYGYVNLRGTESFEIVRESVDSEDEDGLGARKFWSAAGMIVQNTASGLPEASSIALCDVVGECGPSLTSEPSRHPDNGTLVYNIIASSALSASANETYFNGWTARACAMEQKNTCLSLDIARGEAGQILLDVPRGEWELTLRYKLPYLDLAWVMFSIGTVGTAAWAGFVGTRKPASRGRVRNRVAQ